MSTKNRQRTSTGKIKNMMYTQQLKHLPLGNLDDLEATVRDKIKPEKYGLILHDKDTHTDGTPATPHIHCMMTCENPRYISAVAKLLKDKPQYIENFRNGKEDARNGFSYLIHRTEQAMKEGKHQYSPLEVRANFDYPTFLKDTDAKVKQAGDMGVKSLLDRLYIGAISKKDVENRLSGSQYARYKRQIEEVHTKMLQRKAEAWRENAIANHQTVNVTWIYGDAGTGKTSLSIEYAKKQNEEYFIAGSSRDIFQGYNGESTLIIDEFRPGVIVYSDMLRIFDPFGATTSNVMLPSRYTDKALSCDTIIITTPYEPYLFYREMVDRGQINKLIDDFSQLLRRITLTINTTPDSIMIANYDEKRLGFFADATTAKKNPYSAKNRTPSALNQIDIFNQITDF